MLLKKLFENTNEDIEITGIETRSNLVKEGNIFIAIKGKKKNGNDFILEAIERRAAFIVTESAWNIPYPHIRVKDAKEEEKRLSKIFYGINFKDYSFIGVTGTDGKTTTSLIIHHLLNSFSKSCYIGTNGIYYDGFREDTLNTTISPLRRNELLAKLKEKDIRQVVLEASSEGIVDGRLSDLPFDALIFTNLSHEHLNTHNNMEQYYQAKKSLFNNLKPLGIKIINADDYYGKRLIRELEGNIITYGIFNGDIRATHVGIKSYYLEFDVEYRGKTYKNFQAPLFGLYNIYNLLATLAYMVYLRYDLDLLRIPIKNLPKIEGRFEVLHHKNKEIIIDFAHTPNAIKEILTNLRLVCGKRIITILGAQGEKDQSKRRLMGQLATKLSDIVIFTSEDPKNEPLVNILSDLITDLKEHNYYLTYDRKKAIELGISLLRDGDILVILGKGKENYEIIYDYKFPYNDLVFLSSVLSQGLFG